MQCCPTEPFRFDLTEEQKRLCDWVAQQACTGVRQIRYEEATAALDIHDEQLTRMLRGMRERLDEIHAMVEAPIVHTQTPYFEVPLHARYIWDNYRRAEKEGGSEFSVGGQKLAVLQS
jgi:hypothetical protein